ncbi:MAG: histidine phosphatase family protein [Thermodesulfobacteriota bacterium]
MIKIYIARHGETIWNAEGRIQGRSDPELSPKGHAQGLALLEQLKERPLSAVYTSTLQRTIHTARHVAEYLKLPIRKQPELDEIAFGILEGKQIPHLDGATKIEWDRFKEDRYTYHIPQAENYTDVANRVQPFVERILSLHQGEEILIVGHRVVNLMLIRTLTDYPPDEISEIQQSNDCLYLIKRNGETEIHHYMNGEAGKGFLLRRAR